LPLDATGKASFDDIYVQDDPRTYFRTLRELDYCIPQLAKPYFAKLIQDHRETEHVEVPTVLDVGCSYGVNAALLRCDATIDELDEHYGAPATDGLGRDELVARDRDVVRARRHPGRARFLGLDTSAPALAYAQDAGLLDDTLHADLEAVDATDEQRRWLAAADIVTSTGCLGYVTERTIRQIAESSGVRLPWMAHFVLRMFPYDPVAESLAELGYETVRIGGLFKQRRFASTDEQAQVLDGLADVGVDPQGWETEGWLYAQLHISRPPGTGTDRGRA
jgi:carnitine O-acetyltransferase